MKRLILKTIDYILFIFFKENKLSRNNMDPELRKKYAYLEAWLINLWLIIILLKQNIGGNPKLLKLDC